MSDCRHCNQALSGPMAGSGYKYPPQPCSNCMARAVARSMVAHDAVRTRDTTELRETLARTLPGLTYEQAAAMVRKWWQHDHPPTRKEV